MSSETLSVVIERQIHRLCLHDFPCGNGSWRSRAGGAGTEDADALLDLLSCPRSPWRSEASWSPEALPLKQLAVLSPQRLRPDFIHNYFTTLRIVDKGVSAVDGGLLRFSKLEELVLTANKLSEIPAENLPSTLKILELRDNRLSALDSLTGRPPPPHLVYLGLGSNCLGSHDDICHLTGRHWPQLVCLDLSDCDFEDQRALLRALSTLPRLRTLMLEGNPFTLASCYPGFAVDSLPELSCLDASWISPEERHRFTGLSKLRDLTVDQASVTVNVGRMKGIPDPLTSVDENTPDFPVVTYSYFVTYDFINHPTPANLKFDSESKFDAAATAHETEDVSIDVDPQSDKNCVEETSKSDSRDPVVVSEKSSHDIAHVTRHSTAHMTWSECINFGHTQTYTVSDLQGLKRFLNQGLYLEITEEKVLSWPAVSEDVTVAKPSRPAKEKKGRKETPVKSGSTKDKSKDKKKKSVPELVQDSPITRSLGSVHVPLQGLIKRGQKVTVLCDFGTLHTESEAEARQTLEKDLGKKAKEERKKEDKEPKRSGGSGSRQRNTAASKGKGRKENEVDVLADAGVSVQPEPVTLELSVELDQWQSAPEARRRLLPRQSAEEAKTKEEEEEEEERKRGKGKKSLPTP